MYAEITSHVFSKTEDLKECGSVSVVKMHLSVFLCVILGFVIVSELAS